MKDLSRRSFIKTTSAASVSAVFIPEFISRPPNSRLKFGVVGVGGRGRGCWKPVPIDDIVAMCDVDDRMTAEGHEASPKSKKFKDFRKMLDKMGDKIDAVIIATPDHTHFPAAMASMEMGKHVFVEKPLAHNIWQLRTLKKAAKHYGIVSQMGNQGHTTNGIRLVKEWYEAGVLGQVREVIAWQGPIAWGKDRYFAKTDILPPPAQDIPKELDWDLWLGPAAERPFNNIYVPRTWRAFYDLGNGKLGDWCCHTLDAPFWALDMGLPHTVEAELIGADPTHSVVADESVVTWQFGPRGDKAQLTMKWYEGFKKPAVRSEWGIDELPSGGMIMIGDKKSLITGVRPNKPKLLVQEEEWIEFQKNPPAQTIPRVGEEQPVKEWVKAIKNGSLPGSNFDYACDLMEMAQVGVLTQRFGGTVKYDAENMKAAGRPELDPYIKEPAREGWVYGEGLL